MKKKFTEEFKKEAVNLVVKHEGDDNSTYINEDALYE